MPIPAPAHLLLTREALFSRCRAVEGAFDTNLVLRESTGMGLDSPCPVMGLCPTMGQPRWQMSSAQFKVELKRIGMSKRRLAGALNVSRSSVYRWATGEVEIPGPVAILMRLLPKGWKP